MAKKPGINLNKVDALERKVGDQQAKINWMQTILIGAVILLVVEVATLLISVGAIWQQDLASKEASNQELINQINQQNIKSEILYQELKNTKQ